jgi:phosphate:Na+ symporter
LPIIAIAFPMLFVKRESFKNVAEVLIGFAILFMGLEALKDSVPDLQGNADALSFLSGWTNLGIGTTIIFVLVGTFITLVVQSSSAAMALTLTLLSKDIITLDIAAAMVLGENIGTTITANLAAMIANVHAKRAARAHLIFNVFGVVWMIIVFKPFLGMIEYIYEPFQNWVTSINPNLGKGENELMLSLFHTSFNIINTLLLVWFVDFIARTVVKLVPSKGGEDDEFSLEYIGGGVMGTPELSLLEAYKEVSKFGQITSRMNNQVNKLLESTDPKKRQKLVEKVGKYEEITDNFEIEIANYLTELSKEEMSPSTSARVRGLLSITDDLEKIGDLYYQITMNLESKNNKKVYFVPKQRESLKEMFVLVEDAFEVMKKNLDTPRGQVSIAEAEMAEDKINELRNEMRSRHLKDVEKSKYSVASGMVYNDVFIALEKIGDHIFAVSEGIIGRI